jgi:hypothetical protein
MLSTTIICGVLLIIVGIAGYVHGVMNDKASVTALIPAFFGFVFVILGAVSNAKESLRKHLMHVAVTLALVGFLLTAGRIIWKISEFTLSAAALSQLAMAVICLVLVLLGIRSFTEARRNRV